MENIKEQFARLYMELDLTDDQAAMIKKLQRDVDAALRQPLVSSSCSCGIPYVETKKSDIPYDTDDNVYYTDILIHHCPKCGNIDRIDEY